MTDRLADPYGNQAHNNSTNQQHGIGSGRQQKSKLIELI